MLFDQSHLELSTMVTREDYTILHVISDILSVITISTCFILKIPQIVNILRVKHARGISLVGLTMELFSYTVTFSYNFRNNYALLSYMEYPIILIQELLLILCVMYYKDCLTRNGLLAAASYFLMAAAFLLGIVPVGLLSFLVPLCTPIGASSKVIQLVEILKTKNSESVSLLTWFISAFTNLTRIFTIYMDSADLALLLNFAVNLFLSSSILFAAYIYKYPKQE